MPLSKISYHIDQSIYVQSRYIGLCLMYTLFQPWLTFLFSQNKISTKKQLNFSNSIFCCVWKTEQLFIIFFFTYHSRKYFIKTFYCLLYTKVPYKSFLLSIITCRHLLLTYHTQKHFEKRSII